MFIVRMHKECHLTGEMVILRVCKDVTLLGEKGNVSILNIR